MPTVLDLQNVHDPSDVVHRAVAALAEGKIIAVPTETVYGVAAHALNPSAVKRLCDIKGRGPGRPLALAVKSANDALDYVPDMSPLARRLTRRCWPGPLTVVFASVSPDSVVGQLPEELRNCLGSDGSLGLRVPADETLLQILRFSRGPLLLSSANGHGCHEPVTAQEVVAGLGDQVDFVIDSGPCRFGKSSTVVRIDGNRCEILREGVIARKTLKRMANFTALMVCTGNTCRSPMAECLMKKHLASRLGCKVDQLTERGVNVLSAGVAASGGSSASRESIEVMALEDLDLSLHESQPVTELLVRSADLILTMTQSHRNALVSYWPEAAARTFVISDGQEDVSDPIGGPLEMYQQCASQIDRYVQKWVEKLALNLPEGLED